MPTTVNALQNFTYAHKYDQKLNKCIGISFANDGEYFDVGALKAIHARAPYKGGNDYSGALNNIHKHRVLFTVRAMMKLSAHRWVIFRYE